MDGDTRLPPHLGRKTTTNQGKAHFSATFSRPTTNQHTMSAPPIAYIADDAIKATASTSGAASLGLADLEAQARPGQSPYAIVGARTAPKSLGAGVRVIPMRQRGVPEIYNYHTTLWPRADPKNTKCSPPSPSACSPSR